MTTRDVAVRHKGKAKRLVFNETAAVAFEKDGTATHFQVTAPAKAKGLPTLEEEGGALAKLSRIAKPCSCSGGVWKTRLSELEAQL